jgi:hypothetical protein
MDKLKLVQSHIGDIHGIFRLVETRLDGIRFIHLSMPLSVISSIENPSDNKLWLHVSLAHKKRIPTHDEVVLVKNLFIGENNYAISVLPPRELHVNLNPYCLHLYHCLEGHPLPEFSGILNGVRSI